MDGAVDAGLIARSPCTLKGRRHRVARRDADRQPEQLAQLAAAVGPPWEALVFAAAYTGLRWGELAGLRRCDVDLEQNLVTVTFALRAWLADQDADHGLVPADVLEEVRREWLGDPNDED